MTARLSQQQLESYLWGAATLLRGVIDAGDYKQFIFPLMFLKRLSDVYDEESARALVESVGDAEFAGFAENHRFQIPGGEHWSDLRAVGTNVGTAIQRAMREIETANQDRLFGIFGDAQWTNKERLPDSTLKDLIEHFSTQVLSLENVPEDEFGQAYEYLIKKFADDSGHTAAEFYTNRTLVHLMTLMLDPQPGESIYDPTCGTGGMLLSAVVELRRRGQEWRTLKLFGQERNLMTSAIARMNLFLHGIEDFQIERDDTLSRPRLMEGGAAPPVRRGPRQSAVLHQAVGPEGLGERRLWAKYTRHAAPGPRRLRVLAAHPREPQSGHRPLRDSLPARRPLPG